MTEVNPIEELVDRTREAEEAYRQLAEEIIYEGNSVVWWYSKAQAYQEVLRRSWDALHEAGINSDGKIDVADAIRILASRTISQQRDK